MDTELDRRMNLVRVEVASRLSSVFKKWTVEGDLVMGPGTLAVKVEDQHKLGPNHFDLGFILNRDRTDVPVLWDCAAGAGQTEANMIAMAVGMWASTTASAILEMQLQDGSLASHLGYDDPKGCKGWHVIHSPVKAVGVGKAPGNLQSWVMDTPLLPTLGPMVAAAFERPMLNGVKLLFGYGEGDIAEVRVNGIRHEPASRRLQFMQWPRANQPAFVRCYWLFVHKHDEPAGGTIQ